jgi:ABC-type nickel/cobalt efflux system permease component RcnA
MSDTYILLFAAIIAAFTHTLLGPDHYLPFIVMSKARNWSLRRTLFTTLGCGIGHVGSSIIIGLVGIGIGYSMTRIEAFEAIRGSLSGWAFFLFGFTYMVWGVFKAVKNKPHTHAHFHEDGATHEHQHSHHQEHVHVHSKDLSRQGDLSPWALFIIFVLGPCEILIPLVMEPAIRHDINGIIAVSLLFSAITIATMCAAVTVGYYGLKILPARNVDRYMHAIAGATICLSGGAILFLGL